MQQFKCFLRREVVNGVKSKVSDVTFLVLACNKKPNAFLV